MPEGSLLQPKRPAALGSRTHTMCRWYDVFAGALSRHSPSFATAAGFSSSPHIIFSGYDENDEWFTLFEIGAGGIPRASGRRRDGRPHHVALVQHDPGRVHRDVLPAPYRAPRPFIDSGGAGLHRGGNGVEIVYRFLVETEVAIRTIAGLHARGASMGEPGRAGRALPGQSRNGRARAASLEDRRSGRPGGRRAHLPHLGRGRWGDPLERPLELVATDVRRRLVSYEKAQAEYGVIVDRATRKLDAAASEELREAIRKERGELPTYNYGPPLSELLASAKAETGLDPPRPAQTLESLARRVE